MPNMQTGTGLIDQFNYTIKDANFAFDARFGDGEITLLQLSGINSETGGEENIWLKCGKTWSIVDGGARIEPSDPTKKNPVINKNTQYGIWIDSFMGCDGANVVVADRDMDAWNAESWVGITVELARREKPLTINGEHVTQKYFEIIGIDAAEKQAAPAAATVDIPKAAEVKLKKIAASSGTYEEFIDSAYGEVEGLTGAPFENHVIDDSDAGFYATHKG